MILIDALKIRSGGGYGLLVSLVNGLIARNIDYTILLNDSLRKATIEGRIIEEDTNSFKRKQILKKYIKELNPTCLFTFNFPPPFRPSCKVITDFQNLHLAQNSDITAFSLKEKANVFLKRLYLKKNIKHTDVFIFPTDFVKSSFLQTFSVNEKICKVLPHFDEKTLSEIKKAAVEKFSKQEDRFIYVSSPSEHKNHPNLIEAWRILLKQNIKPTLALSLPLDDARSLPLLESTEALNKRGAKIININDNGVLPYQEVLFQTYKSSFTIFPSVNETFGFGLVEGAFFDNRILASNKSFVKWVVNPSEFFDPYNPQDIANSVVKALEQKTGETSLVFKNRVNEIIDLTI